MSDDKEHILRILQEAGAKVEVDPTSLTVTAGEGTTTGYGGFFASFIFRDDDKLDHVEIWE